MWSDRDTQDDCLGFSSYVSVLAEICMEKALAPLTLGIFGSWGSGKTSLMRMLKCHIEQSAGEKAKTLWFNAWRYEGKEEAQSALIHSILNKLSEDKGLLGQAKETMGRLVEGASVLKVAKFIATTAVTLTPDLKGFIDCFKEESAKIAETMESFEGDFEKLVEQMGIERIIVFIDDLDRCQSAKVIETFETIKLFLNIPQCTFVIGADAAKIEQAVSETYRVGEQDRRSFATDYLEKIVQIPFRIPEQQLQDIACYVGMLVLGRYATGDGWKKLLSARATLHAKGAGLAEGFNQWVLQNASDFSSSEETLRELGGTLPNISILAHGLRGNPRQVKRFLNILALRQRLGRTNKLEMKPELLIKMLVVEYAWKEFFVSLVQTFDPTTGSSPLLVEVLKARGDSAKPESPLVAAALETPALVDFLKRDPRLDATVNLAPYLFLAQTALGSQRSAALTPYDETARALAERILSDDRVRSEPAARQAARSETAIAQAVVRILLPKLIAAEDDRTRTNAIVGLDTICQAHKDQYHVVVPAIDQLQLKSDKGAAALAVSTLLEGASNAGVLVPEKLRGRFAGGLGALAKVIPKKDNQRGRS